MFLTVSIISLAIVSGVIVILGLVRGELKQLWNYGAEEESSPSPPPRDPSEEA